MDQLNLNLGCCNVKQIINFNIAFNEFPDISIFDEKGNEYDLSSLEYGYSIDGSCWSCYMSYDKFIPIISSLTSDFYIRIKLRGIIVSIKKDNIPYNEYSTQLDSDFNFDGLNTQTNKNMFNPYANLDCAITLQQQLSENVAALFGIPVYYFKVNPQITSKDLTFKEYTLMNVDSVKQIKIVVKDGQMPSAKPEFGDLGLDWDSDWEVEITKGMFATAFGNDIKPMEHDLVYIPMMKRMWEVTNAYEEKNEGLMWIATSFKIMLAKYQEKEFRDLGDVEDMVNSFVKNKYEDLFGDEENLGSGTHNLDAPLYATNNLYNIYESDAIRKYITCDTINIKDDSLWYKGKLIADSKYVINDDTKDTRIIYQREFCGDDLSSSFIITPLDSTKEESPLISFGNVSIIKKYKDKKIILFLNKDKNVKISLNTSDQNTYFIICRYSKKMNIVELSAYQYVYETTMPKYKLNKYQYWFDMENPVASVVSSYNIELQQENKNPVIVYGLLGSITNIKLLDVYNDNNSELLMHEPTNSHLYFNDTARKIVGNYGVLLK